MLAAAIVAAGCATAPPPSPQPPARPGGYYQDDGPPAATPADILATPDAVPRIEPFHSGALRPYTALGRSFTPITDDRPLVQRGLASWYGRQFHGSRTSTGERYDMFAMTAAHPTMPLPSYATVTHLRSGASVIVRVNDRGPFRDGRVIDLSYAAAMRLGIVGTGTAEVEVRRITHREIAAASSPSLAEAPPARATAAAPSAAANPPTAAAVPASAAAAAAVPSATAASPVAAAAAAPAAPTSEAAAIMVAATTAASATGATSAAAGLTTTAAASPVATARGPANAAPAPAAALPAATATATPPEAADARWAVQLGAFRHEANAQALHEQSARALAAAAAPALPPELRAPRIERDGDLHRVLLGWLPDRDAAAQLAALIASVLGRDTAVVLR